jgi:xylan 1,4-beta-xylosidase
MSREVSIEIDLTKSLGPWKPIHHFYGCDEPNYAYMKHGKRLLEQLGKTSPDAPVYFRTHNLFSTGDGTPHLKWGSTNIYTEDADGKPVYDFTILDRIMDAYITSNVKPYFQLGFMPKALSTKPEPYEHHWDPKQKYDAIYTGWAYPPKDYGKWSDLCYEVTKHYVEKYGKAEVESWYFQTWNEPNIGYWKGTREEFFKLHDYAIAGVRRALPRARVGGPDLAGPGGDFMTAFIEHCVNGTNYATGEKGTPLDFISHHAKGMPTSVDGHVRMGINRQLKNIDDGMKTFAKYPQTKNLPIVIGESDPEGCAACQGPDLQYRNGTMYSSYTAASFARKIELNDRHGTNLEGALTWAFLFEEQPLFAGFRVLASDDIDHAVLNVFRFFAKLGGERVAVKSSAAISLDDMLANGVRGEADVSALATRDGDRTAILVWHYHDDDVPAAPAKVMITLNGLPATSSSLTLSEWRIDQDHGNAFPLFVKMGSPKQPTADQLVQLKTAATNTLLQKDVTVTAKDGSASITIELPRQGVSLLELSAK